MSTETIIPADSTSPAEAVAVLSDEEIFASHEGGKLSISSTVPLASKRDLSIAYTPGVAQVSRAIHANPELAKTLTWAQRLVVVVSDGTAVLGLGNIGASASLPVMEGKSALFKAFGELDSIPLVLNTTDVDEIVETLVRLRPSFGAVNLEDISAPRCFELEEKLIEALDCPVMHDDQHGTAVVVLAALTNAAKVTGRTLDSLRVVVSGAGAAGIAVAEILLDGRDRRRVLLDSRGAINKRPRGHRRRSRQQEGPAGRSAATRAASTGGPGEALLGADVFIGVSSSKLDEEHLKLMNHSSIVFALSNPDPEVLPEVAAQVRRRCGHRPQRLPEPDQQRPGLPRHLPRRPRRRRPPDHAGHEACRGPRHRGTGRGGPVRRLHRAQPAGPARGPGRLRRSRRSGGAEYDRVNSAGRRRRRLPEGERRRCRPSGGPPSSVGSAGSSPAFGRDGARDPATGA